MYDLIIIGAGPAGLTAGIYAGRAKLKTLIIEKALAGGQISSTNVVDNYPGSIQSPSGMALSERMLEQAQDLCQIVYEEVKEVNLEGKIKTIKTDAKEYQAKTVIISTGASPRKLDVKGEDKYTGFSVSYCSTCDGPFYQDLDIYVIGGGEAALEEAEYLTRFGRKVTIVHRRDGFRASKIVVDRVKENPKIDFALNCVVEEIKGNEREATELLVKNTKTGELSVLKPEDETPIGVFVFIGHIPQTELFEGVINMENGYIITDDDMKTNVEGVFAVGDTRAKKIRQIVTATADGCIGAEMANKYLNGEAW
ncbi:MAG: thioredoxin-disulfide reductase [Peptoniphilaceae bacterium]|nr:thioredoxin-disulfide reductase [Peptoniphilaceae bacterium]MDY6018409.1 thioredoxin-disulfide reductase [Anaerococcus sp.]